MQTAVHNILCFYEILFFFVKSFGTPLRVFEKHRKSVQALCIARLPPRPHFMRSDEGPAESKLMHNPTDFKLRDFNIFLSVGGYLLEVHA